MVVRCSVESIMVKKYYAWVLFSAFVLLLVFSTTPYARVIDSILWPVRFGILVGISILFVRSWWRHRTVAPKNSTDDFLTSVRRWYYGEPKR